MSQDVPPPPPWPPSAEPPYGGRPGRDNPKALWAMILGFVGLPVTCLCGFGMVLGVPAVILGWQSKDGPTGRWLAIGGIVLGAISIVLGAVWLALLATGAVHPGSP